MLDVSYSFVTPPPHAFAHSRTLKEDLSDLKAARGDVLRSRRCLDRAFAESQHNAALEHAKRLERQHLYSRVYDDKLKQVCYYQHAKT